MVYYLEWIEPHPTRVLILLELSSSMMDDEVYLDAMKLQPHYLRQLEDVGIQVPSAINFINAWQPIDHGMDELYGQIMDFV